MRPEFDSRLRHEVFLSFFMHTFFSWARDYYPAGSDLMLGDSNKKTFVRDISKKTSWYMHALRKRAVRCHLQISNCFLTIQGELS
jgi:hypothetical protein